MIPLFGVITELPRQCINEQSLNPIPTLVTCMAVSEPSPGNVKKEAVLPPLESTLDSKFCSGLNSENMEGLCYRKVYILNHNISIHIYM